MDEGREGFVLVLVVVALLSLGLLLHGALVLVRTEHEVARAGEAVLQARARAGRALRALPGLELSDSVDGSVVASGSGPGGRHTLRAHRLGGEWWLAEARGLDPEGTVEHAALAIAWRLDPAERVARQPGVVGVGVGAPVVGADRVEGSDLRSPGDPPDPGCPAWEAVWDSLALGPVPPVATLRSPVGLGLLGLDELGARIPVEVSGRGTPVSSVVAASCGAGAWSWGDPVTGAGPCAARWVARRAPADLVVEGGGGQGFWAVAGDLVLTGEARLRGMAVVGGRLRVEGGARFEGLVLAGGGVGVDAASRVVGSACLAARALEVAAPWIGRPRVIPGGSWSLEGRRR